MNIKRFHKLSLNIVFVVLLIVGTNADSKVGSNENSEKDLIVFNSDRDGKEEIYIMDINGENLKRHLKCRIYSPLDKSTGDDSN